MCFSVYVFVLALRVCVCVCFVCVCVCGVLAPARLLSREQAGSALHEVTQFLLPGADYAGREYPIEGLDKRIIVK